MRNYGKRTIYLDNMLAVLLELEKNYPDGLTTGDLRKVCRGDDELFKRHLYMFRRLGLVKKVLNVNVLTRMGSSQLRTMTWRD